MGFFKLCKGNMYPDFNLLLGSHRNMDDPIGVFVKAEYQHLSRSGQELIASNIKNASVNSTNISWPTIMAYVLCYTSALSLYLPNSF